MESERDDRAFGSEDLAIGSNSNLYVIQNLDSKSSKNPWGQFPTSVDSSYASEDEKLLEVESGGVSRAEFVAGAGLARSSFSDSTLSAVGVVSLSTVLVLLWLASWYERPKHHIGWSWIASLTGSGSQNSCTMRR
jgi:hypothetical protein